VYDQSCFQVYCIIVQYVYQDSVPGVNDPRQKNSVFSRTTSSTVDISMLHDPDHYVEIWTMSWRRVAYCTVYGTMNVGS